MQAGATGHLPLLRQVGGPNLACLPVTWPNTPTTRTPPPPGLGAAGVAPPGQLCQRQAAVCGGGASLPTARAAACSARQVRAALALACRGWAGRECGGSRLPCAAALTTCNACTRIHGPHAGWRRSGATSQRRVSCGAARCRWTRLTRSRCWGWRSWRRAPATRRRRASCISKDFARTRAPPTCSPRWRSCRRRRVGRRGRGGGPRQRSRRTLLALQLSRHP